VRATAELEALGARIDSVEARLAEDDAWLDRNGRMAQGYGLGDAFARRLEGRARRAALRDSLVEAYDQRVQRFFRRFGPASPVRRPALPEKPSPP
jgi:hypothetical protein